VNGIKPGSVGILAIVGINRFAVFRIKQDQKWLVSYDVKLENVSVILLKLFIMNGYVVQVLLVYK
jgi:hypothetical protein